MSHIPVPPGSLTLYAGSSAPNGWLICDGSAVSRTTYAALFAAISTTWGAGDGSTTFNLPDLRGRSPVGPAGSLGASLAGTGGEVNHTLVAGEMPVHNHGVTDPQHNHTQNQHTHTAGGGFTSITFTNQSATIGTGTPTTWNTGTLDNTTPTNNANSTGVTTNNAGSGSGHNNMHPYACVNYIIKAL